MNCDTAIYFFPISVVMMSVQVFGLFLAIEKLKASIKGCEGREKKEKKRRVCAQDIIVLTR